MFVFIFGYDYRHMGYEHHPISPLYNEIKEMYKIVNDMVGDIVKVTPSSKMVGDFAIFMVQNELTPENIYEKAANMAFPDSVVSYFKGMMGQPMGGFPEKLQKLVLKDKTAITCRPGELLPSENFEKIDAYLKEKYNFIPDNRELISYALYPEVYSEFIEYVSEFGDLSRISSDVFFHGLTKGETCEAEIGEGKVFMIKLLDIGKMDNEGNKTVVFEVNGNRREIKIKDTNDKTIRSIISTEMADLNDPLEIGATIPGAILKLHVKAGDKVSKGQALITIEAMKMETQIHSSTTGEVEKILVNEGQQVKAGELLIKLK